MSINFSRLTFVAITVLALSGCSGGKDSTLDPEGKNSEQSFSVELNSPDSVEQNTVFTMAATSKDNEGSVAYKWSVSGDVISEDENHHTMLPALGDYTFTVVGVDSEGNEDSQSKTISVIAQPSLNSDFSFAINVSDKAGYALEEASVTVNGTTVMTDQYGLAQFVDISQTSLMLVSAAKEGFLTQTTQYNFDSMQESAEASLTLQNINPISQSVNSSEQIDITETELHTKLIIEANSFVDEQGNAVTGDVEITITPIDIRAVDTAFLGGGQALTDSGEAVALISTGMADFQFSQNGSSVSLAEGASAIIEMDLAVTTGDDGRVFVEGDSIEMWWFDPETGFWIEDGMGTVQLSSTSETGLKLVATVNHFTTWNWDYYMEDDPSSITFNCLKDGQPLLVNESCQITASSTSINRQFIASNEGVTVLNTSPNVTYSITANATIGGTLWAGNNTLTTVSGENTVSIDMESTPTETGYFQCRVINDQVTSIVPCNTVISSVSMNDQGVDSIDFNNFRASFQYVKGDVLVISSEVDSGLSRTIESIDTAKINGTLDVEIVFDIKLGSLQCSATLNGADMEYFPCDALVEDTDGLRFAVLAENFIGAPPKASFTYSKDASALNFEIASILDDAILREARNGYYIAGLGTELLIDLTVDAAVAHVTYNVVSEDLYSFKCIDEEGADIGCYIRWYNSMEATIFEGTIDELTDPAILPTWMNSKIFIEAPLDGYATASSTDTDQSLYTEEYEIDNVTGVITFTLMEELY
jgi:hypothetical protein